MEIQPAVVKAASDSSLFESSYQKTNVAFRQKTLTAPLARMESFAENDDELEQVMLANVAYVIDRAAHIND